MPEILAGPGVAPMVPAARMIVAALVADSPRRDDIEQVVSELVTNAVLHSRSGESAGEVRVSVDRKPGWIRVEVTDQGPKTQPRPLPMRVQLYGDELRETGRGLILVGAFADRWGHQAQDGRALFWAEFAWEDADG